MSSYMTKDTDTTKLVYAIHHENEINKEVMACITQYYLKLIKMAIIIDDQIKMINHVTQICTIFFKLGTAYYKQLIKENEGWTRRSEIFISLAVWG